MRDFDWSKSEKKAATAAFNLALTRELKAIRREAEAGGSDRTRAILARTACGSGPLQTTASNSARRSIGIKA